jgi:hypothetical protein
MTSALTFFSGATTKGEIPLSSRDWWQDLDSLQQGRSQKTVSGAVHSGMPKPSQFNQTFRGRKVMATAFGTERCFAGDVHEPRNCNIKSVP